MAMQTTPFATLLRQLRLARRHSQETLAFAANTSTRHLSCLETAKSRPSEQMVVRLAQALQLDLRARNLLLTTAGFSPSWSMGALDSSELAPVRKAVELVFDRLEPFGAVLVDRCWNLLQANRGAARMIAAFTGPGATAPTSRPNLMRLLMSPDGIRPWVVNWEEAAQVTLNRLERDCMLCPWDVERHALLEELRAYPGVSALSTGPLVPNTPLAVIHLKRRTVELRLFTMLTTLGTPFDVTAAELAIETFFAADAATEEWFRAAAD